MFPDTNLGYVDPLEVVLMYPEDTQIHILVIKYPWVDFSYMVTFGLLFFSSKANSTL